MTIATRLRQGGISAGCYLLRPFFRRWRRGDSLAPRRILVLRPCCLGDVLMTTPLLDALAAAYPDARITYAVGQWSADAVARNPHVAEVMIVPDRLAGRDWPRLVGRLRRRRFDLAFLPERSPLFPLAAALARIPRRVGLDSAGRGFALTDRVALRGVRHETDLALDLARALDLPAPTRRPTFRPGEAALARVVDLLTAQGVTPPLFVIHPGGGSNPGVTMDAKRWRPERFGAVADGLLDRHGGTAILVGTPGDSAAVAAIRAAMAQPALDWAGTLDRDEFGALCQRAALYLGNDAGTTHLAEACGAPTVVIFGPTDPAQYGPVDGIGEAVWDPVACGPHLQRGDLTRLGAAERQARCIDAISVEQVLAAAERVLARAARRRPATEIRT